MKKRRQREQIGWRGYWRSGLIGRISSKKRIQMEMNFVMMKKLVIAIVVMLMDAWQIRTSSLEKKVEATAIKEKLDQDLPVLSLTKIQFGGDQGLRAEDYSPIICFIVLLLQQHIFSNHVQKDIHLVAPSYNKVTVQNHTKMQLNNKRREETHILIAL